MSFTHNDPGTSEAAWAAGGAADLPELPLDDAELAGRAFIVLAAHPDDESLGAGGLLARLHAAGATVRVLLCTAGEASHPGSPTMTPEQLAAVRLREFGAALTHLLGDPEWQCLGLPDGKLGTHREQIRAAVLDAAADCGPAAGGIVLVAPLRSDGHTDHDVLGSVAAELSAAAGYALLEYPIWYWLWAAPGAPDTAEEPAAPDAPADRAGAWRGWFRLPLRPAEQRAKAAAMAAHVSQVAPLSGLPGDEVLLPADFLAHFERAWETFAWHPAHLPSVNVPAAEARSHDSSDGDDRGARRPYAAGDAEHLFDAVHAREEDPWGYTSSWYEQRKRSLTLAALPAGSYAAGLEIGCSIGTLSAELAPRCGSFLAVDASSTALDRAAKRLAHLPAARTLHLTVPNEWPDGSFDLIVVSEVGYYLSPAELGRLLDRIEASLLPGGTLVLCHWRHPVSGWELDGDAVHAATRKQLGWAGGGFYRERDFVLEVLLAPDTAQGAAPGAAPDRRTLERGR